MALKRPAENQPGRAGFRRHAVARPLLERGAKGIVQRFPSARSKSPRRRMSVAKTANGDSVR